MSSTASELPVPLDGLESEPTGTAAPPVTPPPAAPVPPPPPHPSAMRRRMNKVAEFIGRRLFRRAVVNERLVEKIRELSERRT